MPAHTLSSHGRRLPLLVLGFLAGGLAPLLPAAEPAPSWQAGTASAVITPKQNLWLAGYAARVRPADGTAQDLYAKSLAIVDAEGGRFVFLTVDAIGVPRGMRKNLFNGIHPGPWAPGLEEKIIAKAMELARSVSPAAKSPDAK